MAEIVVSTICEGMSCTSLLLSCGVEVFLIKHIYIFICKSVCKFWICQPKTKLITFLFHFFHYHLFLKTKP